MTKEMTHVERAAAALADEKVDRLPTYPIACGVTRRLLGDGNVTYRQWASDAETYSEGFLAGQKRFDLDFAIGLMDLSVIASDFGAGVRFDEENTPAVNKHIIHSLEDYENLTAPESVHSGRTGTIIDGTAGIAKKLNGQVVTSAFLEGPLLTLSQSAGAERLFLDAFDDPGAVHKALETITDFTSDIVKAVGETGINAICWDYLWGNYSCLGDPEYLDLEGSKYAPRLNRDTLDNGMAVAIHNCADLPHLDTQVKKFKPSIYSMAYYPTIEGSPSPVQAIENGYADDTLLAGAIEPQLFVTASQAEISKTTRDLIHDVKTALCERGLNSRYVIASGCEVPPSLSTRLENIDAVSQTVKQYGGMEYRGGSVPRGIPR